MAFNNALVPGVTTRQVVYTAPVGAPAIIIGMTVCNTTSILGYHTVEIETTSIVENVQLPANSSFSPLDGKIVLLAGQSVYVTSDVPVDVTVGMLEVN